MATRKMDNAVLTPHLGRPGHWRPGWRPGWGWGAAGIAAASYPWWGSGYGYDDYAYGAYGYADTDPCLQERTVRRGGVYRTVLVRVC